MEGQVQKTGTFSLCHKLSECIMSLVRGCCREASAFGVDLPCFVRFADSNKAWKHFLSACEGIGLSDVSKG